ncbi:RNA polymerase, sigma subunit, ECF family [Actinacidiphila rubida]|uniref:RNA polymerase, sigma subunit, ECF family n=1 Tax=Actinacidiphila rubida TaxID=310780 RepID=A0A1H8T5N0_9ACTN|nr:RNA polymerase, sigma subunit, ECF family [Actinacidiphila rubida]
MKQGEAHQEAAVEEREAFAGATEPFRRELLAHCYRLLGSVDDATDVVQETYLRAWRSHGTFEGRSSMRTWLYRIATNACLSALAHHSRRVLPAGLGGPEADPGTAPVPAGPGVRWLQPVPDALVAPGPDGADDPAAVVVAREDLRLALVASLQYLSGAQRAVLLLRDVLSFPAAEVAAMLGTTTAAVKSTLQRARARLRALAPEPDDITPPTGPEARALLDQYIAAFQNADAPALERLLRRDATLEATPFTTWFAGNATCVPYLRTWVLGSPGDWLMLPTSANGQPAAVAYTRDPDGAYQAYGVVVLTVTPTGIRHVHSFHQPALAAVFGFPRTASAGDRARRTEPGSPLAAVGHRPGREDRRPGTPGTPGRLGTPG